MREIKFRAWDIVNKKMFDVGWITWQEGVPFEVTSDPERNQYFPGQFILIEYTGLKDKNDKEIYEGDILLIEDHDDLIPYPPEKIVVSWMDGCWRPRMWLIDKHLTAEVIGNIYENQEVEK